MLLMSLVEATQRLAAASTRRPVGEEPWQRIEVASPDQANAAVDAVLDAMAGAGYRPSDLRAMRMALREALANAIEHGHGGDTTRPITVRSWVDRCRALAEVEDQGPGFDPRTVPDPRRSDNLLKPGGRGIFLMRTYLTWIRYNGRGNCVTLCRHCSA
jgi:serine/threonine-protein kinase RsbW